VEAKSSGKVCFLSVVFICIAAEDPVMKRGILILLTGLFPFHSVPVPSQDLDFQGQICGLFVFSGLKLEVIVRFVDIGGIVYHHCLHILFLIMQIT
jgi:hypothetical protein